MAVRWHTLVVLAAILAAGPVVPALAQSTGQPASGALAVSVTVVRSCGVSAPATVAPSAAPGAGEVRVSCGRAASTSSLYSGGLVPVTGAPIPVAVSTSKSDAGLVLSVNF
jgi:hypothetical protein